MQHILTAFALVCMCIHMYVYMCVYNIHIRMAMYMPSQLSRKFSALSKKYFKNHVDFVGSKLFIGNVLPDIYIYIYIYVFLF